MHCELGKWRSRTLEIWSSCTLGLGPWTYHATVLCLSLCWSFCLLFGSLRGWEVPKERDPDLTQLACLSMAYCQHPHFQQHCHRERSPSRSLLFSLVFSQRYRLVHNKCSADSRFSLMHTQTTGRQTNLFLSRDESPMCDCIKTVHRIVHINNGYLFCLIFFSCPPRHRQAVESCL